MKESTGRWDLTENPDPLPVVLAGTVRDQTDAARRQTLYGVKYSLNNFGVSLQDDYMALSIQLGLSIWSLSCVQSQHKKISKNNWILLLEEWGARCTPPGEAQMHRKGEELQQRAKGNRLKKKEQAH